MNPQTKSEADASGNTAVSADMKSMISRSAIKEKVYAAAYATLIAKQVQPGQAPAGGAPGALATSAGQPARPAASGN